MTDPITRLTAALAGRYAIDREIGEGGMATVHLAEDLRHERKVALKVLKPELAAVVGAERFLAEIKTTANLQHPHILALHDSGEADSFLYYVMPYVEGETLADRIAREKQLPVDDAVAIATKVAGALQHAHEHGIIHRDIKPGNILIQDGEPVVGDFGIALAAGVAGGTRLTETGLSVGTPFYMSPEQATGDQGVGPQTDIYALACVLYEMLVGEPPYLGNTAQAVLGKILQGLPMSATAARTSVPTNVDAAIRKALEKLPVDRFTDAQGLAKALADPSFRHGEEAAEAVAAAKGPWKGLSMALGAVALVSILALGWSLLRPEPPQPVTRQVLSTEGWGGLDGPPFGQYAAIAPDGSSMVLPVGTNPTDVQLALKMRESTEITLIPGTEGGSDVAYSPDGEWIAYVVGEDLFKRPLVGGSSIRLAEDAEGLPGAAEGLAWLDDGTILYEAADPLRLLQIPEDGGEARLVFQEGAPIWVHGLPGGQGALVTNIQLALHVIDLRDPPSTELVLEGVLRAWYAPSGHIVYVRTDGALFAVPFDPDALTITGSAIPLFDGIRVAGNRADIHLAADGTLLYVEGPSLEVGGTSERLRIVDLEGNGEDLVLAPRDLSRPAWSPDGQSVAYGSEGQIYVYNVELRTTPRQLTFEGINFNPTYSPDGSRVAFSSARDGTDGPDLFVKNLGDDSPPRPITTLPGNQLVVQWPLDTLIVFESNEVQGGSRDLWMVDVSDPDSVRVDIYLSSEADLNGIAVSPDGTLAAYASDESGQDEIYIRSFPEPGGQTVVSDGGGGFPSWSPDGNTLYHFRFPGAVFAARLQRNPVPVVLSRDFLFAPAPSGPSQPGSWLHPDGDRLIITRFAGTGDVADVAGEPSRLILVQNFFEELRQVVPDS